MKDARPITHCRLCTAEMPAPFLDLGETALANELVDSPDVEQDTFPLQLVRCGACEHVQLTVAVDPKRLFPPTYPYRSGTSPVFRSHLDELAEVVTTYIPLGGALLDVGSNDETFLRLFDGVGCRTVGVDPAAPAESELSWREHFNADFARRLAGAGHRFNCITALNVFAHVDDLHDFTAGVAELLADDGVFIFEVGYLPDIVEKGNLGVIYHEHLDYHHLLPLQAFFERHGLVMYDAHRIASQGGSVRCFVRRANGASLSERMAELWEAERKLDVNRLCAHRVPFVPPGRVAGYGAPAKLTTLLALNPALAERIDCVFDDNPLKIGKYTPGTHIPIVSSAELMQRNPDALVLFSANFADEIKSRFPEYRGEWIIP